MRHSRTVELFISSDPATEAAKYASALLRDLLREQARVRLLAATGSSQLEFLRHLTGAAGIDWCRVELFHLDEYIGLGETHPASFARYIRENIVIPTGIPKFHLIDGTADPGAMIAELSKAIISAPMDLAFAGIGENGHLAFNDPPADFETNSPFIDVSLDDECRRQQVGEGWFTHLSDVPRRAITISIRQLMQSKTIVSVVSERRKATAVAACLEGAVSPKIPASQLRSHPHVRLYLDFEAASLIDQAVLRGYAVNSPGESTP